METTILLCLGLNNEVTEYLASPNQVFSLFKLRKIDCQKSVQFLVFLFLKSPLTGSELYRYTVRPAHIESPPRLQ